MKQRTHWLALSLVVLAYGSSASTQPRRRITAARSPRVTTIVSGSGTPVTAPAPGALVMQAPVAPVVFVPSAGRACLDASGMQTCGLGACAVTVPRCQGGRALQCNADMNRRVPETCDGVDNDCDGVIDNAPDSSVARGVCPAAPACEPVRALSLTPGAAEWRVDPASGNACAPPFPVSGTSSHALQVVTVASRLAVVLSTDHGGFQLLGSDHAGPVLEGTDGLCEAGKRTGAAILEPGTYVLRANGDGAGARTIRVEAVAVPSRASAPLVAASARVTMSTATGEQAPFNCESGDGVDVRVLVCPRGQSATLSASQGFLASVEGSSGARTCYPVAAETVQSVGLPSGSLVVVRAWPSGAERGPAFVDIR